MCFAMTALPLGCDKAESDSVLLNVVALADFLYILMPWHLPKASVVMIYWINWCLQQWTVDLQKWLLVLMTWYGNADRATICASQLLRQNKSCSAFYSCLLLWWDRLNQLCTKTTAVISCWLLLCGRIIWFLLRSKYRWDLAHCRSKTGILQSWCGLGCWLVQLPFECKLQKPIAEGVTWTFLSLDSITNFCLKIIQVCAEAGTCAHVNVLLAYLASRPDYNSILHRVLELISFTTALVTALLAPCCSVTSCNSFQLALQ